MKARPRNAENRVCEELNKWFVQIGHVPVSRIPTTGRTGPDIEINALHLVIDVKSRIEVPKSYMVESGAWGNLIGVSLKHLDNITNMVQNLRIAPCKTVSNYFSHMDEWTKVHRPGYITALVLHRPGMPFGKAVFIINQSQREELTTRWTMHS
jgi:hypothetical protein